MDAPRPIFLPSAPYCPREEATHGIGGLPLGGGGDVGVGVQGKPGAVVAQHAGYRLNIHSVLEGQSGKGVPEIVEPDLLQPCPLQNPVEHVEHAVWGDGPSRGGGEDVGAGLSILLLLVLQDVHRIVREGDGAVGVLGFQWCLYHLAVNPGYLSADPEGVGLEVDIGPLEPQQLTPL